MTGFEQITFERIGPVATLRLNDPATRNSISERMRDEIMVACEVIERDTTVRSVILSGVGVDFSSGANLREFGRSTSVHAARATRRMQNVYRRILSFDRPTIAVLNGIAVGGGLELALACDVRIASVKCVLGLPEVRRGLIPGGGGTQTIARRTSGRAADDLVLGGELVDAEEGRRRGLIHEVVPSPEAAATRAMDLASDLATLERDHVVIVKRQLLMLS